MIAPRIARGDARHLDLPDNCADLVITSPPYWKLRSYTDDGGEPMPGQIGLEATLAEYLDVLADCTREWMRILKPDGSLFVNMGDCYLGQPPGKLGATSSVNGGGRDVARVARAGEVNRRPPRNKSLAGQPWRYAIRCMDDLGLWLRAEVVWWKTNPTPDSAEDRVGRQHEQVFHFTQRARYFSACDEIREPQKTAGQRHDGRSGWVDAPAGIARGFSRRQLNPLGRIPGSVWPISAHKLMVPSELGVKHYAAFPPALVRPIIWGFSPRGICRECGQGRRPVTERTGEQPPHPGGGWTLKEIHKPGGMNTSLPDADFRPRIITGYRCDCATPDAPTDPAFVVDPMGGAGTTALVASVAGRRAASFDLSEDYCRIARWRVNDPAERAAAAAVPAPPPIPAGMEPLFDLVSEGETDGRS